MAEATCGGDVAANNLFDTLVPAGEITLPSVDLDSVDFAVPTSSTDLLDDLSRLTEADLTTRTVGGTGMFDGLMEATKAHLHAEYTAGRLTGKDYTEAYVSMTTAALSSAVQYLLSRDQQFFQAVLVQKQAQAAEIAVVQAKIQLETVKAQHREQELKTKTVAAQYALTKMQIAATDAERCRTQAQETQIQTDTTRITAQKDQILYETANILPEQLANLVKDKDIKTYQVENVLPAQVANLTEDTQGKAYNRQFIMVEQYELAQESVEAARAKTLDTRTDGTTPITGSIGKQKELHTQQIESYKRDAEWKVAKGLIDVWITGKSMDENFPVPTSIEGSSLNTAMAAVRGNLGI